MNNIYGISIVDFFTNIIDTHLLKYKNNDFREACLDSLLSLNLLEIDACNLRVLKHDSELDKELLEHIHTIDKLRDNGFTIQITGVESYI